RGFMDPPGLAGANCRRSFLRFSARAVGTRPELRGVAPGDGLSRAEQLALGPSRDGAGNRRDQPVGVTAGEDEGCATLPDTRAAFSTRRSSSITSRTASAA